MSSKAARILWEMRMGRSGPICVLFCVCVCWSRQRPRFEDRDGRGCSSKNSGKGSVGNEAAGIGRGIERWSMEGEKGG